MDPNVDELTELINDLNLQVLQAGTHNPINSQNLVSAENFALSLLEDIIVSKDILLQKLGAARHTLECKFRNLTEPGPLCRFLDCENVMYALQHAMECSNLASCVVPDCRFYKIMLLHRSYCIAEDCKSCCISLTNDGKISIIPSKGTPALQQTKSWHQNMTIPVRIALVTKLTQVYQRCEELIVNPVLFARQFEVQMFLSANSRAEYYHGIAEKIYHLQKKFDDRQFCPDIGITD